MILGETLTLQQPITLAAPFVVASASVTVRDSSNTLIATATPGIDPGTSSTTQTLSYTFTPPATGLYDVIFLAVVGSETHLYTQRVQVQAAPFGRGYPQATDLQQFLEAHGLVLTPGQLAQLPRSVDYGVSEFERRVGRRMVAGVPTTEYFAPPTQGNILLLRMDLAAAPNSVTYQPSGGSAQSWTLGTDYVLEPNNGPSRPLPLPYTSLRALGYSPWFSPLSLSQQSIAITGQWGYALDLPANAQEGMLALAALRMAPLLTHSKFGGLTGWGQADLKVSYAPDPLAQAKASWQMTVDNAVSLYRRWEVG